MRLATRLSTVFILGLALIACAQQPLYTPPYTSAPAVSLTPPLPVTLVVTYSKDGKQDAKRAQALASQLRDLLAAGQSFSPVGGSAAGMLTIAVEDNATTKHLSLFAGFSAMLGRLFIGQAEFTPQGRRTARALDVDIRYVPGGGGGAQSQVYTSALVAITNNTQEPTDLVPMPDRDHAELTLIGNDLNLFAAELAKASEPAKP